MDSAGGSEIGEGVWLWSRQRRMLSAALPANRIQNGPAGAFKQMLLRRSDAHIQMRHHFQHGKPGFLTEIVGVYAALSPEVGRHFFYSRRERVYQAGLGTDRAVLCPLQCRNHYNASPQMSSVNKKSHPVTLSTDGSQKTAQTHATQSVTRPVPVREEAILLRQPS